MLHCVERDGAREIGTPPRREPRGGAMVALTQVFARKLGPASIDAEHSRQGAHAVEVASGIAEGGKEGRCEADDRRDQVRPAHREPKCYERSDGMTDDHRACVVRAQVLQAMRDRVGVVVGTITGVWTPRSTEAEEVGNDEPRVVRELVICAAPVSVRGRQTMK